MHTSDMIKIQAGACIIGEDDPISVIRNYGWNDLQEDELSISREVWFRKQHEIPCRIVWVDSFWIDINPVTNGQYAEFVKSGGYETEAFWDEQGWEWVQRYNIREPDARTHWNNPHRVLHPVAGVNWFEASAYAKWADKRLPIAEEWEKAARGTDGRVWPWGNIWKPENLNSLESGINDTTPVGGFPAGRSPYGCYDMAGNVDEWIIDTIFDDNRGLKRGGTWHTPGWHCRCSHRCGADKYHRNPTTGFRCAKDA